VERQAAVLVALLAVCCAGCVATGSDVPRALGLKRFDAKDETSFTQHEPTAGLRTLRLAVEPRKGISTSATKRVKKALLEQLESKGFSVAEGPEAALLKVDILLANRGSLHGAGTGGKLAKVRLKVALVPAGSSAPVLEGQADGLVTRTDMSWYVPMPKKDLYSACDRAVAKVVQRLAFREPTPPRLREPPAERDVAAGAVGQRWAVVIGISQYKDTRIPALLYADDDARAFHDWLLSPQGGAYSPERVRLLLDEQATAKNIRSALWDWASRAIAEDLLVIYIAAHGTPSSPDTPENLFIVPYDADHDSIASTGFPMWDIDTALKRFIKAKKVAIFADACHAAGVGQPWEISRRDINVQRNTVHAGLSNLSQVGDGVAIITSADNNQLSQEGEQWGGGHGVFTYFLIEGLKGHADSSGDGQVTIGELVPYLSENVRRETRSAQTPTVSGRYDPNLPLGRPK